MNIGKILPTHARYRPNHPALIFGEQRWTYRELNQRVNRLANALVSAGICKGDKVATLLNNCPELYETYWAVAKLGAVVVPLSTLLRAQGLATLIRNSDTGLIITDSNTLPRVEEVLPQLDKIPPSNVWLVDQDAHPVYPGYHQRQRSATEEEPPEEAIDGNDLFNIIYSSGTTGEPKGIMHTHYIRAMYMTLFANAFRIHPESMVMHSGSIIFNGSFLTLMPAMFLGATFVLLPYFDVDAVIRVLRKEKITHTILVPSQIVACLQSPEFHRENAPSLEMILTVGAPLHPRHKAELDRRIPGVFYELYGLTEGFVTILDKNDFHRKMGSVGAPPAFFDMRIVDDDGRDLPPGEIGEIAGKGPILMTGYYKQPELTAQAVRDGWLFTGDLGFADEEGYLYLVDRKKDLIISGGVNVYPKDIESILIEHPAVKEAAVFGISDERWGETPIAAVVLKSGQNVFPEELVNWTNERVDARFQKIRDAILLDDFPRNVAGKTLKRVIRKEYLKTKNDG